MPKEFFEKAKEALKDLAVNVTDTTDKEVIGDNDNFATVFKPIKERIVI